MFILSFGTYCIDFDSDKITQLVSVPLIAKYQAMFNLFQTAQGQSPLRQRLQNWCGEAIVERAIAPRQQGRVKFRGSYWFAQSIDGSIFNPGMIVYVTGRQELTLLVTANAS